MSAASVSIDADYQERKRKENRMNTIQSVTTAASANAIASAAAALDKMQSHGNDNTILQQVMNNKSFVTRKRCYCPNTPVPGTGCTTMSHIQPSLRGIIYE